METETVTPRADPLTIPLASGSSDGQLLSWGCGEFGQHGHGETGQNVGPEGALVKQVVELFGPLRIKFVSCGASHTAIVTENDDILTWGNGNSGQLGCGDKLTHRAPQRLQLGPQDSRVAGVACGSRHTVVWLESGRAFSCGNNFYAQLGYDFRIKNYKENQVLPHLLRPIMHLTVTQVACGEKFSLFLFASGHVAGCGANNLGQLGDGTRAEVVSPKPLEDPEDVVTIACGSFHSMAVTSSGELYMWGMGRPCGSRRDDILTPQRKGTRHSNVVGVAGGSGHSLALTENGTVYSLGGGVDGQLGHGEEVVYLNQPTPLEEGALPGRAVQVACGDSYSVALLGDGSLYMWGKSSHVIHTHQPSSHKVFRPVHIPLDGRSVAMVTCGSWHAAALSGKPVRQALEEESVGSEEEEEEDNDSFLVAMEARDTIQDEEEEADFWELSEEVALPVEGGSDAKPAATSSAFDRLEPPYKLEKEGTTLTLAEFYSTTPTPRALFKTPRRTSLRSVKQKKGEEAKSEDSGREFVDGNESKTEDLEGKYVLGDEDDDDDDGKTEDMDDPEGLMMGDLAESGAKDEEEEVLAEGSVAMEEARGDIKEERASQDTMPTKSPSTLRTARTSLPKNMHLSRSKTMGSIPKKPSPKGSFPRVYDMTAMRGGGGGGDADSGGMPVKFVVDKHVAISSRNTNSPSSSPTSSASSTSSRGRQAAPKKMVATVSVVGGLKGAPSLGNEHVTSNSMPAPKLTRAHTLYGQMRTQNRDKPKGVPYSPPIARAVAPTVSMAYKTKQPIISQGTSPVNSPKLRTRGGVPPLGQVRQPQQPKTIGGTERLVSGGARPLGATSQQRRPMFSSASSWRQRPEVAGKGKPLGGSPSHIEDL